MGWSDPERRLGEAEFASDAGYDVAQAVFDTVDVAIVACDAAGRLTMFNAAARRLHGVPPDPDIEADDLAKHFDLYDESETHLLVPDEVPLLRTLRGEPVVGEVLTIVRADEPPRLMSCDGQQLRHPSGGLAGAVVVMTDITRARRVAAIVDQERAHALQVIDRAADAYLAVDERGEITRWNAAATALFGWTPAETVGRDAATLLTRNDARAAFQRLLSRAPAADAARGVLRETLDLIDAEQLCRPIELTVWQSGLAASPQVNMFLRDPSEQTRIGHLQRQAHDQLTSALDVLPRSITLTTVVRDQSGIARDLTVSWSNSYVRDRLGPELASKLEGAAFRTMFPAAADQYLDQYLQVAQTGRPLQLRASPFTGDITRGVFDITVVPWGQDGLLIDVTDVTAQHQAEGALRASERQLREAQDLAGLASWEWDLRTDELRWSPLMHSMLGVPDHTTPTTELMLGLIHPDDRDSFIEQANDTARHRNQATFNFRVVRADTTVGHLRAVVTVERDHRGRAIRVWGANQDLTPELAHQEQLELAAFRDPLTGLLNRRGWDVEAGAIRDRGGAQIAVAMLDLDHFKLLNDTAGHAAGDEVLRECAARWRNRLRSTDLLCRMGGEEFAVLLPGCPPSAALALLEDMRALVPRPVTASAGLTYIDPGESIAIALRRADAALYDAKREGRNQTIQR